MKRCAVVVTCWPLVSGLLFSSCGTLHQTAQIREGCSPLITASVINSFILSWCSHFRSHNWKLQQKHTHTHTHTHKNARSRSKTERFILWFTRCTGLIQLGLHSLIRNWEWNHRGAALFHKEYYINKRTIKPLPVAPNLSLHQRGVIYSTFKRILQ